MPNFSSHADALCSRIEALSKKEAWLRERGLTDFADRLRALRKDYKRQLKWSDLKSGKTLAA